MDVLIIGAMAYTFLKAQGHSVGSSRVEADLIETAQSILELPHTEEMVLLPKDHVVTKAFAADADYKIIQGNDFASDDMGLDIGPESQICLRLLE